MRQTANAVSRVANGKPATGSYGSNTGNSQRHGLDQQTDPKAYALPASLNGPGHSGEGLGFEKKGDRYDA